MDKNLYKMLRLTRNEAKVFSALHKGVNTPLLLSAHLKISRPTVYLTLTYLKGRGLAESYIVTGRKYWRVKSETEIVEGLQGAKKFLLNVPGGKEEIHPGLGSIVNVYRDKALIRELFLNLFSKTKNVRLYGMQGNSVGKDWKGVMSIDDINFINKKIKDNNIIVEAILPRDWFKHQYKVFGKEWAEEFAGRASATHEIDAKYFDHGGEIFILKDSLYLLALDEGIVIEIKNSQIQKIILALFSATEEHANKVDINKKLRELVAGDTEN